MTRSSTIPVQIHVRGLDKSPALEALIHEQVNKLGRFYTGIHSARVTVEKRRPHLCRGRPLQIRIVIQTTGHGSITAHEPGADDAHSDVHEAVCDAFKAMRRQLEDLARRQQGHIQHHAQRPHGHITDISPDRTFGRMVSSDGRTLYFHRNSLIGEDLDKLQQGTPVYYIEDIGDEGPQATSVYPVGKHHILV